MRYKMADPYKAHPATFDRDILFYARSHLLLYEAAPLIDPLISWLLCNILPDR